MAQSEVDKKKAEELIDVWKDFKAVRQTIESQLKDVVRYVVPKYNNWETWEPASNSKYLFDDTAILANRTMGHGFQSMIISGAIRWFMFWLGNAYAKGGRWEDIPGVRAWLSGCENRLYSVFAQSNLYAEVGDYFSQFGTTGYPTMWVEPPVSDADTYTFLTQHPKEMFIGEDSRKRVNQHIRHFRLQGVELKKNFGDKLPPGSEQLLKDWEDSPRKWFEVLHGVWPRDDRDLGKLDPGNKAFVSRYVTTNGDLIVDGGLDQNRYITARWGSTSDSPYTWTPAFDVMPTIKASQQLRKSLLAAAQLSVEPPMNVPESMSRTKLQLVPKGLNFYSRADEIIKPIQTVGNYPIGIDRERAVVQAIQSAFMTDFFLLMQNAPSRMTATEVMERQGEKAGVLGPVLGRISSEFLDPLIDLVFEIEMKAGRLPPAPPALKDAIGTTRIDTEYVGPLMVAQRRHHLSQSLGMGLQLIAPVVQLAGPQAMDIVDIERWMTLALDGIGAPGEVIRDQRAVDAIRKGRAEAAAKQQQQEMAQQLMGNYKGLARAPEPGSPGMALADMAGITQPAGGGA